jgi:hypothetical protein
MTHDILEHFETFSSFFSSEFLFSSLFWIIPAPCGLPTASFPKRHRENHSCPGSSLSLHTSGGGTSSYAACANTDWQIGICQDVSGWYMKHPWNCVKLFNWLSAIWHHLTNLWYLCSFLPHPWILESLLVQPLCRIRKDQRLCCLITLCRPVLKGKTVRVAGISGESRGIPMIRNHQKPNWASILWERTLQICRCYH